MRALMLTCLLLVLLLSGCASKCADCLTLTKEQLGKALVGVWQRGYAKGFDDGQDAADLRRLKPL